MLKFKKVFFLIFASFFLVNPGFSLNWVDLHREASGLDIKEAEQRKEKEPDSISSLYLLALVYLENYKTDSAKKVFQEAAKAYPGNPFVRWGKLECLRRKYRCQECKAELAQVIEERPDFAPAYITLAYLYYRDMDFDKTADLVYQVIRMGKDKVDLTNYVRALGLFAGAKGMIAHYGGPVSKVINGRLVMPYLQRAKRADPDSAVVKFGLGSYYLLTPAIFGRDFDKAEKYLKKAKEADPNFADIYVRLAQVYRVKGDEAKYKKYLNKALEVDSGNPLALDVKKEICNFICLD